MRDFRVLLINCNTMLDTLITAGIGILSSCLQQNGIEVRLFDTTFYRTAERTGDEARAYALQVKKTDFKDLGIVPEERDVIDGFLDAVDQFRPDLIGLSCIEVTFPLGMRLLDAVRHAGIPTIVGGPYATFAPDIVIRRPGVDMVCVGEGEGALVDLCKRLADGGDVTAIPNVWVKRDGKIFKNAVRPAVDLDTLPQQNWDVYDKRRFWKPMGGRIAVTGTFEMNRGCPYTCSFCINSGFDAIYGAAGGYYREKSIDRLIDEMAAKKERYDLAYVYLVAESFLTTPIKRIERFGRLYREKMGLPFWVEVRPESVTKEKVAILTEIGCEGISVGVESGNLWLRKNVLGRNIVDKTIIRAFELLHETKIRISANNMIGFPHETRAMIFDTIELNRILQPHGVMVSFFSPYKGCTLRRTCEEAGFIAPDGIAGDYRLGPAMDMPQLRARDLAGIHRAFPLYVKFPREEWDEIRRCEADTDEGNRLFAAYADRYVRQFMS
ncbi:MAG: B12-binding domain-containing radical SAM protein [Alphaproteobacteria bacterium]|nr:B12-binding domain-containing radical SAM protein [Alphaproteobacteria bacterium]